jgi:hypothetical protein
MLVRRVKVPEARVELARGCPRWILSPLRLPFRHSGRGLDQPGRVKITAAATNKYVRGSRVALPCGCYAMSRRDEVGTAK